MSDFKDVTFFRNRLTVIKSTLMSNMQTKGESVTADLEAARDATNDAHNEAAKASLFSPTWKGEASLKSIALMDSIKGRSDVHRAQRLAEYGTIDETIADISSIWSQG